MAAVHPINSSVSGFEITFMHMGQGDCCMIRCPDGEMILIDCGSSNSKGIPEDIRARAALALRKYCTGRPLHSLILTHSDKDHYNRVADVLGSKEFDQDIEFEFDGKTHDFPWTPTNVGVQRVYFSDMDYARFFRTGGETFSNYTKQLDRGPLKKFNEKGANHFIYGALQDQKSINLVHLDGSSGAHILSWTWNNASISNKGTQRIANGKMVGAPVEVVHKGDNWHVTILAGNVRKTDDDKSDSDGCNAASLITLLQIGAQKCLICGDATVSTEAILLSKFPAAINKLDILQVPHHGSGLTSSSAGFINATQAKEVVMSVARVETSYHLPGLAVLDAYLGVSAQTPDEKRLVDGWRMCKNYVRGVGGTEAYKMVDYFTKTYPTKVTKEKGMYLLSDDLITSLLESADGEPVCIAVAPIKGYMLYRQKIDRELYQTGLEGAENFFVFTLDAS